MRCPNFSLLLFCIITATLHYRCQFLIEYVIAISHHSASSLTPIFSPSSSFFFFLSCARRVTSRSTRTSRRPRSRFAPVSMSFSFFGVFRFSVYCSWVGGLGSGGLRTLFSDFGANALCAFFVRSHAVAVPMDDQLTLLALVSTACKGGSTCKARRREGY